MNTLGMRLTNVQHNYLNSYTVYNGKKMLTDVVILRLTLIFLLIWTHLFAPFNGSWGVIPGLETLTYPKWIVSFVSAARMPGLIFVSGYLLGYTANRKSQSLGFNSLVKKKFYRLFIPSLIFSFFYYLCFLDLGDDWNNIIYTIINGAGHLWFLPMLFWCFIIVWISERFHINKKLVLVLAIIACITPTPALPLRLSNTAHFFMYFYFGYTLQRRYLVLDKFIRHRGIILLIAIFYVSIFLLKYNFEEYIYDMQDVARSGRILSYFLKNIITLMLGTSGVLMIYCTAHILIIPKFQIPTLLVMLSSYCYGVYIYHQFILRTIYYHTPISHLVQANLIVWIVFPITIILSLLLTHITLKTKLGRKLIG